MDIVDTRFQQVAPANEPDYSSPKHRMDDLELGTLLFLVLQQLTIGMRKPLLALSYRLKEWFREMLKYAPDWKKLPWLKLCILTMVAFLLFKKDMQVQFAVRSPLHIFNDNEDRRTVSDAQTSIAQTVALYGDAINPLAPAKPETLKDKQVRAFVRSYAPLAIEEMHKSGVPASITIGQALIESRCGKSALATKNNNFFGIKCFSRKCPKGHCTNMIDDHHKDFFRKYKHAKQSFRHHSQLLTQGRYKHLIKSGKDYKAWAKGLKKAGYATDKTYDKKLIEIIEEYQLFNLDKR